MSQNSFIKNFWKEKKMVGAMSPSSSFLAKKMLQDIDFSTAKVIVELGPGTGVFTKKIIEKMTPDTQLFVFELNEAFIHSLQRKIQDPRVHLIHDSAENIGQYLAEKGIKEADAVISSLPLTNFPKEVKENILDESKRIMKKEGYYVQFQYSLNAKKLIKERFSKVEIRFTPINFPPAFVYSCQK